MLSANAVMLGHHFIPLEFLQHDLRLLLDAAWHSSQLVHTLCVSSSSCCFNAQGLHHGQSHAPRCAFSALRHQRLPYS